MGAWELVGYYNYVNNKVSDTFEVRNGYRQVKMFSPSRVIWAKKVPADSTEWFGYGTYCIKDGKLIEILDYGSIMMSRIIQEKKEFVYELQIDGNTFSQINIDDQGNRYYSENYIRVE